MKHLNIYKVAESSRIPINEDVVISTHLQKKSQSSKNILTIRCKELKDLIDIYNSIVDKYQELMFKMPSNCFPPSFPKSFSSFRESFENFVRTIEAYIFQIKSKEGSAENYKRKNIIMIIDQSCSLSEKLTLFMKEAQSFNETGMGEITKTIDFSFQKLFKTNTSINTAIKNEKIVNQEMVSKGLDLYRNTYKAFKLCKDFFSSQKKDNNENSAREFNIEDLKIALSLVNTDGFHLLTKKVPTSLTNKGDIVEMRSAFSTNCGYIGSLVEVAAIFNESLEAIIMNLTNLTKLFNDVIYQCNIPTKVEINQLLLQQLA
ncbi:hypothetical protein TVAG_429190 [Trichomonas vaginalis G3]|uniref:Uncharacterized protein n=1 Tax=Trichomonas vaginalis (strain ATCC PRA-98 / G3) TaxID=412133 RepID=A2F938_TRIV3|nr:hypothetical protein TVAGG3_0642040 [Trichomonas vaginalis G3]EAX98566.1 hypothetical protein TVAG_429190 [Trichomonas vaginalis G3]KAI5505242.1 hypothetical protein TVAGG3_0642040 [Trichomonas vaginalis G3]|eukprot:XP_001311496.1 hypothetical protein [Trichomonas vaginalis G3]